jgi:hypothetical protein
MDRPRVRRGFFIALALLATSAMLAPGLAQEGPSEQDLKQANNPLASVTAVNVQNYYIPELSGLPDETANTAWLRYVTPFGRWLFRASLPISTVPTGGGESESGLGDLNAFAAYITTPSTSTKMFGVGPLLVAPTATDDALGANKWQGGAAAVFFDFSSPVIQWGGLVTYQTAFTGDDAASDTSVAIIQPLAIWQLGKGTYLRSAPAWVFDLENDTYNVPIGFGVGKVIKAGNTVFNIFIEPQFTILHSGVGQPELQIFTGLNMQFTPKKQS